MTTARDLYERYGGREITDGFLVKCPAHLDNGPSLSVTDAGGKLLINCMAGCNQAHVIEVLKADGMLGKRAPRTRTATATAPRTNGTSSRKKTKHADYITIMPVPADAPARPARHFELGEPSRVWTYRNAAGEVLYFVYRFETIDDGGQPGKDFRPVTYGENPETHNREWVWAAPREPRPLYGLDRLAAHPDVPALFVEGEKCVDAATEVFATTSSEPPAYIPFTTMQGCKSITKSDLTPLAGRTVHIMPDADLPGIRSIREFRRRLLAAGATEVIVHAKYRTNTSLPDYMRLALREKGNDIADLQAANWTAEHISHLLSLTVCRADREPRPARPAPVTPGRTAADALAAVRARPDTTRKNTDTAQPVKIIPAHRSDPNRMPQLTALGYNHGVYYYLSHGKKQVMHMPAASHNKLHFLSLVSDQTYWQNEFPRETRNGVNGINWDEAAAKLMASCEGAGTFTMDNIRGRGVWFDDGHIVLHLGDRLIIDGEEKFILTRPGKHVYEAAIRMRGPGGDALPDDEAGKVLAAARAFNWNRKSSGVLLAGWIALAPICGALEWRPHIWVSGGQGSGKTWITSNFVHKLLGDMLIYVKGSCSEAGIRQTLKQDALPVLFDEAEGEDAKDSQRIKTILQLMRQSSSEIGGRVVKGTTSGIAQAFDVRSMFCLVSIGVTMESAADKSRCTVLELGPGVVGSKWEAIKASVADFDADFARRLTARTVKLIPTIRENAQVLTTEVAAVLGSQRSGDQFGTLLAGAWSLQSSEVITREQAQVFVQSFDWSDETSDIQLRDEDILLQRLLGSQIKLETSGQAVSRTIGEAIALVALKRRDSRLQNVQDVDQSLRRHGVRVERAADLVYFSNGHMDIKRILDDTPWRIGWHRILGRMEGAESVGGVTFLPGIKSRATAIPLRTLVWEESQILGQEDIPF